MPQKKRKLTPAEILDADPAHQHGYTKKAKGYRSAKARPPPNPLWVVPDETNVDFVEFLESVVGEGEYDFEENTNLVLVRDEVLHNLAVYKRENPEAKSTKGAIDSQSLLASIEAVYPDLSNRCTTAKTCLRQVSKALTTVDNVKEVARMVAIITEVLFTEDRSDQLNQWRSQFNTEVINHLNISKGVLGQLRQELAPTTKLSVDRQKTIATKRESVLAHNNSHPIRVDEACIRQNALVLKDAKTIEGRVAFLLLCSGSRLIEVLLISEYYTTEDDTGAEPDDLSKHIIEPMDAYINQTPVAKEGSITTRIRRAYADYGDRKNVSIQEFADTVTLPANKRRWFRPLFLTPSQFQHRVAVLRDQLKNTDSSYAKLVAEPSRIDQKARTSMTAKYIKRVNNLIASMTWVTGHMNEKTMGSRLMRKIYPNLSYQEFDPPVPYLFWVKTVLGHSSSSTSRNYINLKMNKIIKLKLGDTALKLLSELQDRVDKLEKVKNTRGLHMDEAHADASLATHSTVSKLDGSKMLWPRVSRYRDGTANKLLRLQQVLNDFRTNGVAPSSKNIKAVGFGSSVVSMYHKQQKLKKKSVMGPPDSL